MVGIASHGVHSIYVTKLEQNKAVFVVVGGDAGRAEHDIVEQSVSSCYNHLLAQTQRARGRSQEDEGGEAAEGEHDEADEQQDDEPVNLVPARSSARSVGRSVRQRESESRDRPRETDRLSPCLSCYMRQNVCLPDCHAKCNSMSVSLSVSL